jgi:hypothetical protein
MFNMDETGHPMNKCPEKENVAQKRRKCREA